MASTLGFERPALGRAILTALVIHCWTLVIVNNHSSPHIVIVCFKTVSAFVSALNKRNFNKDGRSFGNKGKPCQNHGLEHG
jgi:hypothetical protein